MLVPGNGESSTDEDDFPEYIRDKARTIKALALKKRVEEINKDRELERGMRSNQGYAYDGDDVKKIQVGDDEYNSLAESYEWIPAAFEVFTKPNPKDFEPLVTLFEPVKQILGPASEDGSNKRGGSGAAGDTVMGNMQSVTYVSSWTGRAATRFDDFTDPFEDVVQNQRNLAVILQVAMEANRTIFVKSRASVRRVANATETALGALGDSGGHNGTVLLAVAAGVATVLATIASGGGTLPVLLAATAGGAGALSTVAGQERVQAGGHTVEEVLGNLSDALAEVSGQIFDSERTIARWLDLNYDSITDSVNRAFLVSPRPALAGADEAYIKAHFKPRYK